MKIKLSQEPPDWSHLLHRKAQELRGEFLEMVLGYFICLGAVKRALEHLNGMLLGSLFESLQGNNNLIGILRVLLPLLLFAAGYLLRQIVRRLRRFAAREVRRIRAWLQRVRVRSTHVQRGKGFGFHGWDAIFSLRGKMIGRMIRSGIKLRAGRETEKAK
jgi:hypothetical protein